jgi:hypothetical protein
VRGEGVGGASIGLYRNVRGASERERGRGREGREKKEKQRKTYPVLALTTTEQSTHKVRIHIILRSLLSPTRQSDRERE